MRLTDVFRQGDEFRFIFDEQTALGNNYTMYMGSEGWPWGWTSVPYDDGEPNEHLGTRLGAENLYQNVGGKVLDLFFSRLAVNWPVRDAE